MQFRITVISIIVLLLFMLAVISFGTKQASIVEQYYQERNLSPVFYHLNR